MPSLSLASPPLLLPRPRVAVGRRWCGVGGVTRLGLGLLVVLLQAALVLGLGRIWQPAPEPVLVSLALLPEAQAVPQAPALAAPPPLDWQSPAPPQPVLPQWQEAQAGAVEQVASLAPPSTPVPPAATKAPVPPDYLALLLQQIAQHRQYPASAKRAKHTGKVLLRFELDGRGALTNLALIHSCGFAELDAAALAAVQRAAPFPAPPAAWSSGLTVELPMEFSLRGL